MNLRFGNPSNMLKSVEHQLKALDKNIKKNRYFVDTDGDGFINMIDCRPYNPRMQDIKPNIQMRKRLKKLPIFFMEKIGVKEDPAVTVLTTDRAYSYEEATKKDAPKKVKSSRRHFESVVKKRPDTVGTMEKTRASAVVFTDEPIIFTPTEQEAKARGLIAGKDYPSYGTTFPVTQSVVVHTGHRHPTKITKRENIEAVAGTIHHEHEHVRQFQSGKDLRAINKRFFSPDLPYHKQLGERLARSYSRYQAEKRWKRDPNYAEDFMAGYRKMMGGLDR